MTDLTLRLKKALEFDRDSSLAGYRKLISTWSIQREEWISAAMSEHARTEALMLALVGMAEDVESMKDPFFNQSLAAVLKELEALEKI